MYLVLAGLGVLKGRAEQDLSVYLQSPARGFMENQGPMSQMSKETEKGMSEAKERQAY